jgi:hypothetical protein
VRHIRDFCGGNPREIYHLEDTGVGVRIILRWIFRKWDAGVWTGSNMAQEMHRWRALENAVMNLRILLIAGNFLTSFVSHRLPTKTLYTTLPSPNRAHLILLDFITRKMLVRSTDH